MRTIINSLIVGAGLCLIPSCCQAQDVTEDESNILEGQWTAATYLAYVPSKHNQFGAGVAVLKPIFDLGDCHLGAQVGLQYIDNGPLQGNLWMPNSMVNLSYDIHIKSIVIKPLVELGAAIDTHCHPYSILGFGGAVGYQFDENASIDFFYGLEQWTGPFDKFAVHKAGLAINLKF